MGGQSSKMKLDVEVPRKGSDLNFWYFASVKLPFDSFKFRINGKVVLHIKDVEEDWKQFTKPLLPGTWKLEWEYAKESGSGKHPGDAAVWIDDIEIKGKS